jgi:hypothetical protein
MASAARPTSDPPRLVAVDLDGTLLTSDRRVTTRTRAALAALGRANVHVVITTGRPPRSARHIARELGLQHPFICYNGAAVFDPALGTVRVRHHLPEAPAREALVRLRRDRPGMMAGLETEGGWYLDDALHALRFSEARLGTEEPDGVGPVERFLDRRPIKLFARHPDLDAVALGEPLADLPLYRTWSSHRLLELLHPEVNKQAALAELAAERGITREQVAAFGDQRNDIEMLAWAGTGVAMANACPEARAAADQVTDGNDEEGVARVLEAWLAGTGSG